MISSYFFLTFWHNCIMILSNFFFFDWMWVCCERITAKHKALKMNTGKKKISRNENEIYITSDLHFNFKINMLGLLSRQKGLHQYNLCCFSLDGYIDISAMLNFWFALNYINPCQLNISRSHSLSLFFCMNLIYLLCVVWNSLKIEISNPALFFFVTKHTFISNETRTHLAEKGFQLYYKLLK